MNKLVFLFVFLLVSCAEKSIPLIPENREEQWELIPEFTGMDIRYMLFNKGKFYVAVINPNVKYSNPGRGVIFRTSDGHSWERLKEFTTDIGPMTTLADSIYVLMTDSIYYYNDNSGWKSYCETPDRMKDPTIDGDIIFLRDTLYGMVSLYVAETFRILRNGESQMLYPWGGTNAGAKFIKLETDFGERVFIRPHAITGGFFEFDGVKFIKCMNGLSEKERASRNPTNSMVVKDDRLFAGFLFPGIIKYLNDADEWVSFTDTLPAHKLTNYFKPKLKEEMTALSFNGERLFVSTRYSGVLEWKDTVWAAYSKGLRECKDEPWQEEYYHLVTFLENYNGYLFAGYGQPAYAPWTNMQGNAGFGLYRRRIPD